MRARQLEPGKQRQRSGVEALVLVRPLIAAMLLAMTAVATAQEPTPEARATNTHAQLVAETKTALQANDLATVAWAAHAAANYRLAECVPELRATLAPLALKAGADAEFTVLAVLDALVETQATVSSELLTPFLSAWSRDPALRLLGRDAKKNRTILLEQFRRCGPFSEASLACGTWLADIEDDDFLRELLTAPFQIDVAVLDTNDGAEVVEVLEQMPGMSLSHYRPRFPVGFPRTLHHLHVGNAGDPASIRTERETPSDGFCLPSNPYEARVRGARSTWLRRFLGKRAQGLDLELAPAFSVQWRDVDTMRATLAAHRAKLEARHRALVAACVEAKLVLPDTTIAMPTLVVRLDDFRNEREPRLPKSDEWTVGW